MHLTLGKILLSLFWLPSVVAFAANDICGLTQDRTIKEIKFPHIPNYFFKMSPDGKYLFYISNGNNFLLNTETGVEEILPGDADPVPSPDGTLLTYITSAREPGVKSWSLGVAPMYPKWEMSKETVNDTGIMQGSYQSVGAMKTDGKSWPICYFDEKDNQVIVRDLMKKGNKFELGSVHTAVGNANWRLPMMSPDGKYLSVLNIEINKTQIYLLENNKASLVDTLPIAAGKASFSLDSKKIIFHATRFTKNSGYGDALIPPVLGGDEVIRNIYTYDLQERKINQITNNDETKDAYFPIFLADDKVAYIVNHGDKYLLEISTLPKNNHGRNFDNVSSCYGPKVENILLKLAEDWAKYCDHSLGYSVVDDGVALGLALNLSDNACDVIAEQTSDPEMIKLCAAMRNADKLKSAPYKGSKTSPVKVALTGEKLFKNRCLICHMGGNDLSKVSYEEVKSRIQTNDLLVKMPRLGSLNEDEKVLVLDYLKTFLRP